jgi:ABC-type cobalamin/Fe3+-siderophores transport system ATPase subunit
VTLSVHQLAFGYPNHRVGDDLSLKIDSGEVLCFLGPNGCGKTTLFKTMLRLLKAQNGNITINGEDISRWPQQRIAQTLSYVPQQHDAYFPFTVMEVVLMGRSAHIGLFASPSHRDHTIARQAMESLKIEHLSDAVYTHISGGERQLTLIARALAQQTKLLIMDEPTANLDFGNQVLVLNAIQRLARLGITIIMSSHDPDHAFHVASRVALLKDGRLTGLGKPEEVITQESLHELYGVEVGVVEFDTVAGRTAKSCVPKID